MKKIFIGLIVLLCAACSHEPKAVDNVSRSEEKPAAQASIEAKQVAAEQESPFVTEIQFKKGSTTLTKDSQKQLETLLKRAESAKALDSVKVVTWADQEYPSSQQKSLSKNEKDLVKKRNDSIKDFFKKKDSHLKVDEISMAERPNALTEMLGGDDARIKKSLEVAGIPTTGSDKGRSRASKSIVMLILKD